MGLGFDNAHNFSPKMGSVWFLFEGFSEIKIRLKTSGESRDLNFDPICKCKYTILESS